jgi:hypothetical protein
MPDHDATDRVLLHNLEEAAAKVAFHRKTDAGRLLQVLNDVLVLDDRVEFVDAEVWWAEEIQPVEPEIGIIQGRETGLFYRGCVNMLYGTDNCGKTLLMQAIIMQELEAGHQVMYLDGEEGSPRNMFLRLQSMGGEPSWGKRFHYVNINKPPSSETRSMFIERAKLCSLVVVDSCGEFMGMYGKDAIKDLETRNVLFEMYGRPLAAAGPAVALLDHISKSSDGSQPIGTIRKRAAVDGAAYFMSVDEGNEWSKTKAGYGQLTCTKDRNGTYYRGQLVARVQVFPATVSPDGLLVVELSHVDSIDDDIEVDGPPVTVTLPDVEAAIIRFISELEGPATESYLQGELRRVGHEFNRKQVAARCKELMKLGFVTLGPGGYKLATLHSV